MNRWRVVRNVRPLDVAQIAVLALRLTLAEVLLRTRQLDQVAATFSMHLADAAPVRRREFAASRREARWLRNAARLLRRWPWDRSCLRRSLLVGWILRRHEPELVVGTRHVDGDLRAHAWVRIGTVDLDASADEHVTFF